MIMEGEMWGMKKERREDTCIYILAYPSFRILVRVSQCPNTIKWVSETASCIMWPHVILPCSTYPQEIHLANCYCLCYHPTTFVAKDFSLTPQLYLVSSEWKFQSVYSLGICAISRLRCAFSESWDCVNHMCAISRSACDCSCTPVQKRTSRAVATLIL